jgi:5-methylcytosine-specific restriction endonuclease McrA
MSTKNGGYKFCTVCNKKYYTVASRLKKSKWCSLDCWKNRRILNECEYCHKPITSYHGKKYCSRKCSHSAMIGPKSAKWIDGKSLERDRARLGTELKHWRKKVYSRDNYTCQHCQSKGYLHAHHIIEWAKDETQRFNVDNGITLCVDCHSKVHGRVIGKRIKKNGVIL